MILLLIALALFVVAVCLFIKFIVKRDHGQKEPLSGLMIAMACGVLAVILASILNGIFVPESVLTGIQEHSISSLPFSTLLTASVTIGLIEETLKIVPLAVILYRKGYFNEYTDGIIYFGITGLTFGIIEDILYALTLGGGVGILRILLSPYLHIAFTIIFGMQLIKHKLIKNSWVLVILGYIGAVATHAIYDLFAFTGGIFGALMVLIMAVSLNIMVFVFFRHSQKIDESQGKSAVGVNKFCRQCGKKNQNRTLYCAFCGNLS